MGRIDEIFDKCLKIMQEYNNDITNKTGNEDNKLAELALDCINLIKLLMTKESEINKIEDENTALICENMFLDDKICDALEMIKDSEEFSIDDLITVLENDDFYKEDIEEEE